MGLNFSGSSLDVILTLMGKEICTGNFNLTIFNSVNVFLSQNDTLKLELLLV